MKTMEQFEKSLSAAKRAKLNKSIEDFKNQLFEEGYSANFLTRIELLAAVSIRDARPEYIKTVKVLGKRKPKDFNFRSFILMGATTQSNLSPLLFMKAIESVREKGIFGSLNFETGLTGIPEIDRV